MQLAADDAATLDYMVLVCIGIACAYRTMVADFADDEYIWMSVKIHVAPFPSSHCSSSLHTSPIPLHGPLPPLPPRLARFPPPMCPLPRAQRP